MILSLNGGIFYSLVQLKPETAKKKLRAFFLKKGPRDTLQEHLFSDEMAHVF